MNNLSERLNGIAYRLKWLVTEKANGKYTVFANKAGIPGSTFQGYMNGRPPNSEHLLRIHLFFNVNLNWLLSGDGDPYMSNNLNNKESENHFSDPSQINLNFINVIVDAIEQIQKDDGIELSSMDKTDAISDLYKLMKEHDGDISQDVLLWTIRLVMHNRKSKKQ